MARWGKPWHTDDIHPCYLPDGKIMFSSTRCEHTILCGGSAALVAPGLHRMDADGTNIEQLTRSPVSEFCPVVLDDGRVMYHRWEYVDKGARVAKTIRSMNPDGTQPEEIYGVADDTTTVYMYPQPIPGSLDRLVCVGTCTRSSEPTQRRAARRSTSTFRTSSDSRTCASTRASR